jgi:type IV pilus assembly protein PilQ
MKKILGLLLLSLFIQSASASTRDLSLDLQHVNLPDAIRIVSKFMQRNVVVSAAVTGTVTLQLQHASPTDVFALLLSSQGLVESHQGNVLYIAPRVELANRQQEEWKLRELQEETGRLSTRIWQIRYAKAEDIAQVLCASTSALINSACRNSQRIWPSSMN